MKWFTKYLWLVLLCAGEIVLADTFVISDTTFDPAKWSIGYVDYSLNIEGIHTITTEQRTVGTNDVMYVSVAKAGTTSGTWRYVVMIMYDEIVYDPCSLGAVGAINYSLKQDRPTANYTGTAFVCLEQNGKYYIKNPTATLRDLTQDGVFTSQTITDVGQDDWYEEVPGDNNITWDATSHPDFSMYGTPIRVGIACIMGASTTGNLTLEDYFDDISVEFLPAKVRGKGTVEDIAAIPGATALHIEDYVSPDPNGIIVGENALVPSPSYAFVNPSSDYSALDPLPAPAGIIIEAEKGGVANEICFYDPSSSLSMSEIYGTRNITSANYTQSDKIIVRFVNPNDIAQGATVSRVGFYFGSATASYIDINFYDLGGNRILSDDNTLPPAAGASSNSQAAFIAYDDNGVEASRIHKVEFVPKLSTANSDFWSIGGYVDTSAVDIAYYGLEYAQIVVTSPNGGENIPAGQAYEINWTHMGDIDDQLVTIQYYDGSQWVTIVSDAPNTDSYQWIVPLGLNLEQTLIKVALAGGGVQDESDAAFRIYECTVSDITGDCLVDIADFAKLASYWLKCGDSANPDCIQ